MSLKRTLVLTLAFYGFICYSKAESYWLHVRVEEPGNKESVRVNLPLGLVSTVLPLIDNEDFRQGRVHLDSDEITVPQMREIWNAIKVQGDYELATVSDDDMRLRISLEGEDLYIRSMEGSATELSVILPKAVVDALLSGDGDELNVEAGIEALIASGPCELVTVKEEGKLVRVWIDSSSTAE